MFKNRIIDDGCEKWEMVCPYILRMYKELDIVETKKASYYNIPISFDIESSSFYENGEKRACMYLWTACVNGFCFYGRTWDEVLKFFDKLTTMLGCDNSLRIIVYVHNLPYEFQWIRKLFTWSDCLFLKSRTPIYAVTEGIEFRCSYILSKMSLAKVGENLQTYKVKKMVGDLDYKKIRHSETPLSDAEMKYAENDVRVVAAYIKEEIEKTPGHKISQLPYTNTGFVRQYLKENTIHNKDKNVAIQYRKLMNRLTLDGEKEYNLLKQGFAGGFTHANAYHARRKIPNVASFDFTSAYPAVMCLEQFPMSKGKRVYISTKEEFNEYIKKYCAIFEVTMYGVESKLKGDNYISSSKCYELEDCVEDNGRVASASKLSVVLTNVDWEVVRKCYTCERFQIGMMYIYRKALLPTSLVRCILDLYKTKTELKDIESKVVEYMVSKGMINSVYGCVVTDINKDTITYEDDEFIIAEKDTAKNIDIYNNNKHRFLFYPWGVWVTSYCRRNLWSGILECGDDYIYSDTDSIKIKNYKSHIGYIEKYNKYIQDRINYVSNAKHIEKYMFSPANYKGETFTIGTWDFEGVYKYFKTLGAKRYMVQTAKGNSLTVSGLNKEVAIPYLESQDNDIFELFNDDMVIPKEYSGRQTHTYIDIPTDGIVIDYLGNCCEYHEESSMHIEESEFTLSMSDFYINYLASIMKGLPH